MIILAGKRRSVGRPRIDVSIEQIIVDIKAENSRYGAKRISAMVSEQLGVEISETTVRNVLARNRRTPKRPTSPERCQNWKTFLGNHLGNDLAPESLHPPTPHPMRIYGEKWGLVLDAALGCCPFLCRLTLTDIIVSRWALPYFLIHGVWGQIQAIRPSHCTI